MKLARKIDRVLILLTVVAVIFGLVFVEQQNSRNTFAANAQGEYAQRAGYFVTMDDEGERLMVKTTAETVSEVLARAEVVLNESDIVAPGLDAKIDANNYLITIRRPRPVVVSDGTVGKYISTANVEPRAIAKEAGFTVYDGDEVTMTLMASDFLEVGAANRYEISRNGGRLVVESEEIPFSDEEVKDYNLAPGVREIREQGVPGMKLKSYEVYYEDNVEVRRDLVSEEVEREPVSRVVAVGVSAIEKTPLTASRGVNIYTVNVNGTVVERKETYYDLNMSVVMAYNCGGGGYSVREDGAKVDKDGYVIVAANLNRYPRCTVVETSLGMGKVYDTGGFAEVNPEQFDLATDWTKRDGV